MRKSALHKLTLKQQIVMLNSMMFFLVIGLTSAYFLQILSLEQKFQSIEKFNDILQNVLEVRRFEKDILLNVGSDNLKNLFYYLKRLEDDVMFLKDEILQIGGTEQFLDFFYAMDRYKGLFKKYSEGQPLNGEKVRHYGKQMVEFCNLWVSKRREQIHRDLRKILWSFILIPTVLTVILSLLIHHQTKRLLKRLEILNKATSDLLNDNFKPIRDDSQIKDEVSDLIQAFNKMAQELDIRYEEVLQAKKLAAIGTFSSGIAHELNNPLNNISLSADILLEEYDSMSPEEAKEILEDIISQTERASSIVKNLLDFSREKTPSIQPLKLHEVINSTAKLIENELRIKGVHLESWVPDNLPSVLGDFNKLQQVFLNLFLNAIQAMPEGGLIHVDGREEPKGYVRIDVSDTGCGISKEALDKIFDPFFTTKKVGEGTGLGLSIVYGIIKKHDGHIEVKSKLNQGTTFSIFLPVAKSEDNETGNDESCSSR